MEGNLAGYPNLLVSDFDGTITRHDFYEMALARVARGEMAQDYWSLYASGKITHFEAMRGIFSHIRCGQDAIDEVLKSMEPDPKLRQAVDRLNRAGWEVIVVSAGSSWYIEQTLAAAGVRLVVHASPGRFSPEEGLMMELPVESQFCSAEMGIDKEAAVVHGRENYERVAFAGNGPSDIHPALRVPTEFRFARTWLAAELLRRGEGFHPFNRWSEVADRLCG